MTTALDMPERIGSDFTLLAPLVFAEVRSIATDPDFTHDERVGLVKAAFFSCYLDYFKHEVAPMFGVELRFFHLCANGHIHASHEGEDTDQ